VSDNLKRALTVYRVSDDESGNICSLFDDLSSIVSMSTSYEEIPAASDLFGVAINLLLSDTVQAVTTLVAVGDILWRIVSFLKKSGKYFSVDKPAVKCLVPSLLNKDADVDHEALKKAKIWGPMVIASSAGSLIDGYKAPPSPPSGYDKFLMAIALPKEPRRVRTRWFIISSDAEILLTWTTQTLAERVPGFLRPE